MLTVSELSVSRDVANGGSALMLCLPSGQSGWWLLKDGVPVVIS